MNFDKALPWILAAIITLGVIYDLNRPVRAAEVPHVTYKAGRYYLLVDGERYQEDNKVKWWGLDTTAKAAAVNLSFSTGKVIIVEQPNITVTTSYTVIVPEVPTTVIPSVNLTWTVPTEREDGSPLILSDIKGYTILLDGVTKYQVTGANVTNYLVEGLTAGVYTFSIATNAEVTGGYSETIDVQVL